MTAASSLQRSTARKSFAGKRDPADSSAMRTRPAFELIGMIPATIGTRTPARSHRSRKS